MPAKTIARGVQGGINYYKEFNPLNLRSFTVNDHSIGSIYNQASTLLTGNGGGIISIHAHNDHGTNQKFTGGDNKGKVILDQLIDDFLKKGRIVFLQDLHKAAGPINLNDVITEAR